MNEKPDDYGLEIKRIASELKGKTLRACWYLPKNPQETSLRAIHID